MSCSATWCDRETPAAYDYCDDHYQLRDRSNDEPGNMASLDGTRSKTGN